MKRYFWLETPVATPCAAKVYSNSPREKRPISFRENGREITSITFLFFRAVISIRFGRFESELAVLVSPLVLGWNFFDHIPMLDQLSIFETE